MPVSRDFTMSSLYFALFLCLLLPVSVKTSTDEALEPLKIQLDKKCIKDKIGSKNYENMNMYFGSCLKDFNQEFSFILQGAMEIFVKSFCENPNAQICTEVAEQKLDACLNDEQRQYLKYRTNAGKENLKYLCDNSDKAMRDFQNIDLTKCISSSDATKQRSECDKLRDNLKEIKMEDYYKIDACRIQEQYLHCSADILKICGDEATSQFIAEMGHSTIKATPCEALLMANPAENLTKLGPTGNSNPLPSNSTGTINPFNFNFLAVIAFITCVQLSKYVF